MALGLAAWLLSASPVVAQGSSTPPPVPRHGPNSEACAGRSRSLDAFQGFGLGYHLGHGYGGRAIGTGPDGGYPFYGGPGYPHPDPCLNRLGPITPFAYHGGPGGPVPGHPHFYGCVGPLIPDQPAVTFAGDDYPDRGYGAFSGSLPYPEEAFAPFATRAGETGSIGGRSINAIPTDVANAPTAVDRLGMDVGPFVIERGVPGMKVTSITPGGVADKAGLRVGDVILAINGYVTQKWFDLGWILDNAAANKALRMSVRNGRDGKEREISATLP